MYKFKHAYWGEEWQDAEKVFEGRIINSPRCVARLVADFFYEYPFENKYKVEKFACAEIEFSWAVIYEGQLKSVQQ